MKHSRYYITTAIAYASRKPHFGNTYEIIMADAYARFRRQTGEDVYLCTGTDEPRRRASPRRSTLTALRVKSAASGI